MILVISSIDYWNISLHAAIIITKPRNCRSNLGGSFRVPSWLPRNPAKATMGTQRKIASGRKWVEAIHPARPAMELTRMKAALIPEVVRVLAQPEKSMMGERKIPPPVPVRPESPPINPPIIIPLVVLNRFGNQGFESSLCRNNLNAPNKRMTTKPNLNQLKGNEAYDARKAHGTEAIANGQNNFHWKYPSLRN